MKFLSCVRATAAVLLGVCLSLSARADDPVNGAALYNANCASCHGGSPLTSNGSKIYNGRNARAVIDSAISGNTGGMGSLRGAFPAGGTALADVAAYLGTAPTSLNFASTAVGATSATQAITVYASLKGGNAISGLSVATTGDFARAGGTCATSLNTGLSCTVLVSFSPTVAGSRTGSVSISTGQGLSPTVIALAGTATGGAPATAPLASLSPSALALDPTAIGAASALQTVNLANTGTAPLQVSAISLSNTADFLLGGGTCAAGSPVPAGGSCTVAIGFRPAAGALGARSGTLSISHNAAGSPGTVSLSATALAAASPAASLTASLSFGSVNLGSTSPVQTATLSNPGTAALVISGLSTASSEFTLSGGSCSAGLSVAAGGSCTVNVSFAPTAAGARSASLVVSHNASGGQSSTSLSGTGVATNPVFSASPLNLSFSQAINTTSAAQTLSISNTGNAPLTIASVVVSGAQASEFQLATGSTCTAGSSLAANTSCVVKLSFAPAAVGARSASLVITHNAPGSPTNLALSGTGTATAAPAISLNAASLSFAAQTLGSASAIQSLTVSNSGSAALTLGSLTQTGTASAEFSRGGSCAAGGVLAVGGSCSLSYSFTPTALGARNATLTITSNASNGDAVLSLSGTGAATASPVVALAPSALDFGNQTVGVSSTARSVVLTNSGSGALSLSGVAVSTGFAVSHNCASSLPAAATCTLSVSFKPTANGVASGSLTLSTNAAGSPHSVALSGTGVTASPVLAWVPATTALSFADTAVGASSALQSLVLSNQGPGAVVLQQFTLAGAQAAEFALGNGSSCVVNASLAQGASCTLSLSFQPAAAGLRSAQLQLSSTGTNPPVLSLSGKGADAAQASLGVSPASLTLSAGATDTTAPTQTLTLQSTGNAVLRVSAISVVSGSFALTAASSNACPLTPFDLMPGQSCQVAVSWSSQTAQSDSGAVDISTNASPAPLRVAVSAVRAAAVPPVTSDNSKSDKESANAGGGGCSIARADTPLDPLLWLLVLAAAAVLLRRHLQRRQA